MDSLEIISSCVLECSLYSKLNDKMKDYEVKVCSAISKPSFVCCALILGLDNRRVFKGPAYISQLIRIARVCSHVEDLNARNKCLTSRLLKQGYRHHTLRKGFPKFLR